MPRACSAEVTVEPAYVYGTSLGGLIVLALASRHPEQVAVVVAHEPGAVSLLPTAEREVAIGELLAVEQAFVDGRRGRRSAAVRAARRCRSQRPGAGRRARCPDSPGGREHGVLRAARPAGGPGAHARPGGAPGTRPPASSPRSGRARVTSGPTGAADCWRRPWACPPRRSREAISAMSSVPGGRHSGCVRCSTDRVTPRGEDGGRRHCEQSGACRRRAGSIRPTVAHWGV